MTQFFLSTPALFEDNILVAYFTNHLELYSIEDGRLLQPLKAHNVRSLHDTDGFVRLNLTSAANQVPFLGKLARN